MRFRVYLSGPITVGNQRRNYQQAVDAQIAVMALGHSVLNPMLTMQLPDSFSGNVWMEGCLPWVEAADLVLRLPGYSRGAELECRHARLNGITVCSSMADLIATISRHQKAAERLKDEKTAY